MKLSDLANKLVERREISVFSPSLRAHDNLRISLVKFFSRHKKLLADIGASDDSFDKSVSASYEKDTGISTFNIRIRKNGSGEGKDYQVIEKDAALGNTFG